MQRKIVNHKIINCLKRYLNEPFLKHSNIHDTFLIKSAIQIFSNAYLKVSHILSNFHKTTMRMFN